MVEQKYVHAYYQHVDGTSMAAPIVSAVIAQMLEANPQLTPAQVEQILCDTAVPLEGFPRERQGHGVLNAPRAVACALRAPGGPMQGIALSPERREDGVTFHYYDRDATRAAVVGEWNGWKTHAHRLRQVMPGVWEVSIPRPRPGKYAYKFLVEHEGTLSWLGDPENPDRVEDGRGSYYSIYESIH
jgi:serine protease AprX